MRNPAGRLCRVTDYALRITHPRSPQVCSVVGGGKRNAKARMLASGARFRAVDLRDPRMGARYVSVQRRMGKEGKTDGAFDFLLDYRRDYRGRVGPGRGAG